MAGVLAAARLAIEVNLLCVSASGSIHFSFIMLVQGFQWMPRYLAMPDFREVPCGGCFVVKMP